MINKEVRLIGCDGAATLRSGSFRKKKEITVTRAAATPAMINGAFIPKEANMPPNPGPTTNPNDIAAPI